jgi:hypothetical protein
MAPTGTFSTAAACVLIWHLPVIMRAAPSPTIYNPFSTGSGEVTDLFGANVVIATTPSTKRVFSPIM